MVSLPPIPANLIRPTYTDEQLRKYREVRLAAESGSLTRQTSQNPDEDALLALRSALDRGVSGKDLSDLVTQTSQAHSQSILERFLGGLRAVGLPFEAFAEGVNSLIGPLVPQQKFQERSALSRRVLGSMFTGKVSPLDAARNLRDVYEQRSGWEQFITGIVFDPLNVILPGASAIKTGVREVAKQGAKAGMAEAAKAAARTYLSYQIPFGGGKLAHRLGLDSTVQMLARETGTQAQEAALGVQRIERLQRLGMDQGGLPPHLRPRPTGGAAEVTPPSIPPQFQGATLAVPELGGSKMNLNQMAWFYDALLPEYADRLAIFKAAPAAKDLFDFFQVATDAARVPAGASLDVRTALARLALESAGRDYELGGVLLGDIDFVGGYVKLRSVERKAGHFYIVSLTDDTMKLLKRIAQHKAPGMVLDKEGGLFGTKFADVPLFTKGEVLGAPATTPPPSAATAKRRSKTRARKAPKKVADELLGSSGLNTFVENTAVQAGLARPSKTSMRVMVASGVGGAMALGRADASAIAHQLGHANYAAWTTYMRLHNLESLIDEDALLVGRFLEGVGNALRFKPLSSGVSEQAASAGAAVAAARAEVKAAPELKGVPQSLRKGKGTLTPLLNEQEAQEGVEIIQRLLYDAEVWDPRFEAVRARPKDLEVLSAAMRVSEGIETLQHLERVRSYAEMFMGMGKRASAVDPSMKLWRQVGGQINKEAEKVLGGLGAYWDYLAANLAPLRSILDDLKGKGLILPGEITQFNRVLQEVPSRVKAAVEVASRFRQGAKVTVAQLRTLGLSYELLRDIPGLTNLERLSPDVARAAVLEWLSNPKIQTVLLMVGVPVNMVEGVPHIAMRYRELLNKFIRMSSVGQSTAHLLGNDLHYPSSGPLPANLRLNPKIRETGRSDAFRAQRARTVLANMPAEVFQDIALEEQAAKLVGKRLKVPVLTDEEVDALAAAPAPRARGAETVMTESPDAKYFPKSEEMGGEVKAMIVRGQSVAWNTTYDLRSNRIIAQWTASLEKNIAEGKLVALNTIGRNMLQEIALPSAGFLSETFEGVFHPRTFAGYATGWRSTVSKIVSEQGLHKALVADMPGYTSLAKKMVDSNAPYWWLRSEGPGAIEMADGFTDTRRWKEVVEAFRGIPVDRDAWTTKAYGRLEARGPSSFSDAELLTFNYFHDPQLMFAEVPFEELLRYWKLSSEELDLIRLTRSLPREGTRLALRGVGHAAVKTFLDAEPSLDYFHRFAVLDQGRRFRRAPLEERLLMRPGVEAKKRKITDSLDAFKKRVRYAPPVDSAIAYVADMRRLVADKELIELGERAGFYKLNGRAWDDAMAASRTLLRITESLAKGILPDVELEQQAKLLGFAAVVEPGGGLATALENQLGRLATDILKAPQKASERLPEVRRLVENTQEAVAAAKELRSNTRSIPGLERAWFRDTASAQLAHKYFDEHTSKFAAFMQSANKVSSALRMLEAGVDVSFLAIQGLLLPTFRLQDLTGAKSWATSVRAAWKVRSDPAFFSRYSAVNADAVRSFINSGGVWSGELNEIMESASVAASLYGGIGSRLTSLVGQPALGAALKNIPESMERMFTVYLLHARMELWKALSPMARGDVGKLHEVASEVNKLTGVYNPATSGTTQFMRHAEGTFLSFAPMYRRAALGLLVDAFRGVPFVTNRLDTQIAQQALGSLAVVAVSMAYLAEQSGNNPDALNPLSAKFMAFRWGDNYIGIGSAYYSVVRALFAVTEQAMDPKRRRDLLNPLDLRDNQLSRWWRSQAPPIPQLGIDLVLGQSYVGDPLRGEDGGTLAAATGWWALGQITPMTLETVVKEIRSPKDAVVLGEGFGARTFPVSLRDRYRMQANNLLALSTDSDIVAWRRKQEAAGKPVLYDDLPKLLSDRLENISPELQATRQEVDADTLRRGQSEVRQRAQYFKRTNENKDYIRKLMQEAADNYARTHDPRAFRDRIGEVEAAQVALSKRTLDDFPGVGTYLDEQKQRRADSASTFLGDLMYDRFYTNVVFNPLTRDKNNNFLPRVREQLEDEFKGQYGPEWWDYVQARRREAAQFPAVVNELHDAQEALTPYWQVHYSLWGRYSPNSRTIDDYLDLSPSDRLVAQDNDAHLRRLLRKLDHAREVLRKSTPELDWLLVKWYGYQPLTRLAEQRQTAWESLRVA